MNPAHQGHVRVRNGSIQSSWKLILVAGANVADIHWRKPSHECSAAAGSLQGVRLTSATHQTRSSAGWEELSATDLPWQATRSQDTLASWAAPAADA